MIVIHNTGFYSNTKTRVSGVLLTTVVPVLNYDSSQGETCFVCFKLNE